MCIMTIVKIIYMDLKKEQIKLTNFRLCNMHNFLGDNVNLINKQFNLYIAKSSLFVPVPYISLRAFK